MNRTTMMMLWLSLALAACGEAEMSPAAKAAAAGGAAAPEAGGGTPAAVPAGTARQALGQRDGELVNPDDSTMVLLYFDVAGITPPLDTWVEKDNRVQFAQGADKAPLRTTVRQELEAGLAAVRDVGRLRLSLGNAGLSGYDPAYGEFRVGALSPSSVISYSAFGQKVELKFGNGRTAQLWRVPEAEAQAITDRVGGYGAGAELEVLLQISGVQPGMGGGTVVVDVIEYELRERRNGTTVARVRVGD